MFKKRKGLLLTMRFFITTLFLVVFIGTICAQNYPSRPNVYDSDSLRHGEWITFYDSLGKELNRESAILSHYCLMNIKHGKPLNQVECFYPDGIRSWTGKLMSVDPEIMQGQILTYHKNGALWSNAFYENDTLQGLYKTFHSNGILEAEGEMKNNEKTGKWVYFYENGNPFYSITHQQGIEHGITTINYSSGTKYSSGLYKDGVQDGYWEVYHENGILANKGGYKNGQKEEQWNYYHESGGLFEVVDYKNNQKNGLYERYYQNEQLETKGIYKDDLGEGYFDYYHENGQSSAHGILSKHLYQGPWTFYYDNGQIKSQGEFKNDLNEGLWKYYFDNGVFNREVNYQQGEVFGKVTYYHTNGRLNATGILNGEEKDGPWEHYFENGVKQGVVHYKNGQKHGISELGDANGTLLSKGTYENGFKQGYWEFYFDNRNLSSKGGYVQDKFHGQGVFYYENGNKKNEGTYENDLRVGEWKFYYTNGQLSAVGNYEDGKSTGHWVYYRRNGNKSKEGEEYNDVSLGEWVFYNNKGRLNSRGSYTNGRLHGPHTYYDSLGAIESEFDYIDGTMQSFSNLYDSVDDLSRKGDFEKAWLTLESTEKAFYRENDKDDLRKSDLHELFGTFYLRKGELRKSEQYFKKSLKHTLKHKSDTSSWYTSTLDDLADVYTAREDYQKAYEVHLKVVEKIKARPNGRLSDEYAQSQRYLTIALMNLKRHDEAIALLEEDLAFREPMTGQEKNISSIYFNIIDGLYPALSPKLDTTMINAFSFLKQNSLQSHWSYPSIHYYQALVHRDKNQIDSAYKYFDASLQAYAHQNDTINTNFVNALIHMGNYHYNNVRYDLSLPFYERALALSEHPRIKSSWVYISVIKGISNQYWSLGDYANTLKYNTELIKVAKNTNDTSRLGQGYTGVALAYDNMGDDYLKAARENYLRGIKTLEQFEKYSTYLVGSNIQYAAHLVGNDKLEEANSIYRKMFHYVSKQTEVDSFQIYRLYKNMAYNFYQQFDFDSTIYYSEKTIAGLKNDPGGNTQQYLESYRVMGDVMSRRSKPESAMTYYFKGLQETEKFLGKENEFYFYALLEIAASFADQDNETSSIKYYEDAIDLGTRLQYTDQILDSQLDLAEQYIVVRKYDKAQVTLEYVKRTFEEKENTKDWRYINCLKVFSRLYEQQDDRSTAEDYILQALNIGKKAYASDSRDYAGLIRNVGQFYLRYSEYDLAYQYVAPAIEIIENRLGDQVVLYAWYAETLSKILLGLDDFAQAINLQEKAADIYLNQIGEEEDYLEAQYNLGELLGQLGQYERSLTALGKSRNAVVRKYGRYSIEYTDNVKEIAHTYLLWKKPDKARSALEEVKNLYDSIGVKETKYAAMYSLLAWAQFDSKDYEIAKTNYQKAIHIADSAWGASSGASKVYRNNLAFYHLEKGEFGEAERLWLEVEDRFNTTDFSSVEWLDNMAMLYTSWGKLDKAERYWERIRSQLLGKIKGDFPLLSESGKAAFWDAYKADFEIFNTYAVVAHMDGNRKALGQMYDNQLQTKSLLLNSTTKERRRILNSGNEVLIDTYNRYINLKENLVKYYGRTAEQLKEEQIDLVALESQAENLEKALSINSQKEEEVKQRNLTWKSIQKSLLPQEAAVEIIRFRHFDKSLTDSVVYAALILTPETTAGPILELLPNGDYLEDKGIKVYRTSMKFKLKDEDSYDKFWRPIEQHLEDYKKIYLSSDGVYHQMNVATLQKEDGNFVGEHHEFRLVSSTRTIAEVKKNTRRNGVSSAYIFGNPTFDLSHNAIENDVNERGLGKNQSYTRAADIRGFSFAQLPGTKVETQTVNEVLNKKQWRTNLFLAEDALEEELKRVNNPGILHIATHGFFLDAPKETTSNQQLGIRTSASRKNALLRSGLLMTGATQTANGQQSNTIENGIFTAYEAMNLDLSSTELVVLSACETGLGEIKNGEGVFGLQRAFQIAGAESILMSLWKVDDAATQLLMTSFYEAWLSGATKTQALSMAQRIVKASYPHPNYWGAFVLVGS